MPINPKRIFQGDPVIWVVFFLLCMISLVEVFSAASTLSYESGNYMDPLFKQLLFLGVGTAVVWGLHTIPCRYFKIIPVIFYPLCVILLIATLLWGSNINESTRWLPFFGFSFQTSELAKGVLIITVALILSYGQTEKDADPRLMKIILWVTGIVCLLIFTENLSTAVILFATVFLMMFIGRVPLKQLGKIVLSGIGAVAVMVLIAVLVPSTVLEDTPLERLTTWKTRIVSHSGSADELDKDTQKKLDKQMAAYEAEVLKEDSALKGTQAFKSMCDSVRAEKKKNMINARYLRDHAQEAHANIAIASSNVVGKIPGNSEQRDYLSQAYSDFIYAIIIEEMGIFGAVLVAMLYIILLFRAGRIASRCERNFPAFLTMGLAILLVMQAMINMLVAVGLFPVTGQPLPLISRGGTSTIITCAYFGMILSVSRYARKTPEDDKVEVLPPAEADEERRQNYESSDGLV